MTNRISPLAIAACIGTALALENIRRRRLQATIRAINAPIMRNYELCIAEIDAHQASHRRCGYSCPTARAIHARYYPGYQWT